MDESLRKERESGGCVLGLMGVSKGSQMQNEDLLKEVRAKARRIE